MHIVEIRTFSFATLEQYEQQWTVRNSKIVRLVSAINAHQNKIGNIRIT
jgi:hypothetical protein